MQILHSLDRLPYIFRIMNRRACMIEPQNSLLSSCECVHCISRKYRILKPQTVKYGVNECASVPCMIVHCRILLNTRASASKVSCCRDRTSSIWLPLTVLLSLKPPPHVCLNLSRIKPPSSSPLPALHQPDGSCNVFWVLRRVLLYSFHPRRNVVYGKDKTKRTYHGVCVLIIKTYVDKRAYPCK